MLIDRPLHYSPFRNDRRRPRPVRSLLPAALLIGVGWLTWAAANRPREPQSSPPMDFEAASRILRSFPPNGDIAAIGKIAPLVKASASERRKRALMTELSYRETKQMLADSSLRAPAYKLWAFAYNAAGRQFGSSDTSSFTDLAITRGRKNYDLTLLGSDPIAGALRNRFGFYSAPVRRIPVSSLHAGPNAFQFSWSQMGARYLYRLTLTLDETPRPARLAPADVDSPPPGDLNGLVVVSNNLGRSMLDGTVREYLHYLMRIGFEFTLPPAVVPDAAQFVRSRLTGPGAVNLLIKEAHEDAEENSVFDVARKSLLLTGVRNSATGAGRQRMEIIYPLDRKGEKQTLPVAEFGASMRRREKDGAPPLLYLNASCWSVDKAIVELNAAHSGSLIEIPSLTPVNTFEDKPSNAERAVLDGLFGRRSYAAIERELTLDPDYVHREGDVFLFPDQPEYQTELLDRTQPIIVAESQLYFLKDAQTRAYFPSGY